MLMIRMTLAGLAMTGLAACEMENPADQIARAAAKDAIRPVLRERLPGVPIEPATDCVIDNATAGEILTLARAGVRAEADPETTRLVLDIVRRPDTIDCLITEGLPPLLLR